LSAKPSIVLVTVDQFQADEDARKMIKALQGPSVNIQSVIECLGDFTNEQRLLMCLCYYDHSKRSLYNDLSTKLHGSLKHLALALVTSTINMDAELVQKAIKGLGTDEELLLEVLCTRTFSQMKKARDSFHRKYDDTMVKAIKGDTSGTFKKLCVKLLERGGEHESNEEFDQERAVEDAEKLLSPGEGCLGSVDKDAFVDLLTGNSYAYLRAVFKEYRRQRPHGIEKAIEKEFSFDSQYALLTMIKVIKSTPNFFAEKLHKAIQKKHDEVINRILVTRAEVDLIDIKEAYEHLYEEPLINDLEKQMDGHYLEMLKSLLK